MKEIKFTKVRPQEDLKSVLKKLNKSKEKILFCCDKNNKYYGTITDGDVRRAILDKELDKISAETICNRLSLYSLGNDIEKSVSEARKREIKYLPILKGKNLIKVISINESSSIDLPPVVIMAGGIGKRLGQITKDKPKPLVELAKDTSVIDLILNHLITSGFREFYITLNHMASKIKDYLQANYSKEIKINYIIEEEKMGTAGALYYLKNDIEGNFIVMNSDILTTLSFSSLLKFHQDSKSLISVVGNKTSYEISKGVIKHDASRILAIEEKPKINYTYSAGIYVVNSKCLKKLRKRYLDMPDLIKEFVPTKKVSIFPLTEFWKDIGIPEDLEDAKRDLRKGIDG